ncbi:MAG: pimeloyl-ACP methyl ester carboxylesterase [Myxococcota bacterium]|jgi:pimeloyl-ACP methyl ester carboxylesterase
MSDAHKRESAPGYHRYTSLGLDLVAHTWGDPAHEPLLLLHGFLDQGRAFDAVASALSGDFFVIAPDHRGHGQSDWIGAGGYYHFPDYILDLTALVASLGYDRFRIAGHSMGAAIAAYYAGSFPDQVVALAMLDSLGPTRISSDAGPETMRRWIDATHRARNRAEPRMATLDDVAKKLARTAPHATHAQLLTIAPHAATFDAGQSGTNATEAGYRWRFDPLHRTPGAMGFDLDRFRCFLEAITAPTLVVWGETTPFFPADVETRLSWLRDVRTFTLPGASHNLHHEQPVALAATLRGFFLQAGAP